MRKLRNIFYILSALVLCFFAFNAKLSVAYGAPYYYLFSNATSIAVSSDGAVALCDENAICLLGDDAQTIKSIALSGEKKIIFGGDKFFVTCSDKVYSVNEDFSALEQISALDGVSSLAYIGDDFYGVIDNAIISYGADFTILSTTPTVSTPVSVTGLGDSVVYSVKDGSHYSVYSIDGSLVYDRISAVDLIGVDSTLYGVDRYGAIVTVSGEGESVFFNDKSVKTFCASDNGFYFICEYDGVYSLINGNATLITGSAGSESGFYNNPTTFVARLGFSAVCDYLNNRVEISSGDSENTTVSYFSVNRPTSLAIDNSGLIFVSHSANKVSAFNTSGVKSGTDYTLPTAINKVVITVNNEVYALCSNKVYALSDGEFTLAGEGVDTIYAGDGLYYSIGNKIYAPDDSEVLSATDEILSFTRDNAGNYFMLTGGTTCVNLVKYETATSSFTTIDDDLETGFNSIFISRATAGKINYGDVLLVNSKLSKISVIPCADALVDNTVQFTPTPTDYDENDIIRTTNFTTRLYGSANESDILLILPQNKTLIVLNYSNPALRGMSYCACVDATGNLVYGYVFRSTLSNPAPYENPPSSAAIVYAENVKLYSLPSLKSDEIYSFSKDESVSLLPFCSYFDGKNSWYRAKVNNQTVGYVPAYSVSVHNFIPDAPRPQYNASVRSYDNSIFVVCFAKNEDGTFTQIADEILYTGTQIEVIGTFDASQKYTQIKYFDEKLGTLTCYIESVYIEYNSISVVQIVAICVAIATAILMIALLIRAYTKRRKI